MRKVLKRLQAGVSKGLSTLWRWLGEGIKALFFVACLLSILLSYSAALRFIDGRSVESQPLEQLYSDVSNGHVDTVALVDENREAHVELTDGEKYLVGYPEGYGSDLATYLRDNDIESSVEPRPLTERYQLAITLLTILIGGSLLVGVLGASWRLGTKNAGAIAERPKERYGDFGGADEVIEEVKEVVAALRNPDAYRAFGLNPLEGMLLDGPPGTGKTHLARVIAGEANVPFFAVSGAELTSSMFVGNGARRVKKLFKTARQHPVSIIFIDEIEALASTRLEQPGSIARDMNSTLTEFLAQMDGFNSKGDGPIVFVVGATNMPDQIDEAARRPGRLTRHVTMPNPDVDARLKILKIHSANLKSVSDDVDLEPLARSTSGMSGAKLKAIVDQAARLAISEAQQKDEEPEVTMSHLWDARDVIEMGPIRSSLKVSEHDRKITAAHEAGHAIAGQFTAKAPNPVRMTIAPRGTSGGHTRFLQDDCQYMSKSQLEAWLVVVLGGRAAEKMVLGDEQYTIGTEHDLKKATEVATYMVTRAGMGDYTAQIDGKAADSSLTLNQVNGLIVEAEQRAHQTLEGNRAKFDELVESLLKEETLDSAALEKLFS